MQIADRPKALNTLIQAATSLNNPSIEKAKEEGKKVVGFLYQEMPVEILTAAGAVPYFIRGTGSEGTEFADAYFRELACNYVRHTYNQILNDELEFLDGAVFYNSCDHARRIYDNWLTIPGNPVYHFMYIPKKRGDLAKDFYKEEMKKFIEATEKKFGVKITDDDLRKAIKLHNETRRLQAELYEMQKGESVYLRGSELIMIMLAGISMPLEEYNKLLKELIEELKEQGPKIKPEVRLLYTGGHADSKEFFEILENQGGEIVVDNLGFGSRSCSVLIDENKDPLEAIVDYYFDEMPAATRQMGTQDDRLNRLGQLIDDFKVDGVISSRIYMCDIWAFEQYIMRSYLAEKGIPGLELEIDYVPDSQGQIRTRAQAFVESLKAQKNI